MIILYKRPPRLAFIYLVFSFMIHIRLLRPEIIPYPLNLFLFVIFMAAGVGIMAFALRAFETQGTTHRFDEPPTEESTPSTLVTEGLFRYSRNPMYIGFLLLLIGVAALFKTPWMFLAPLAFWLTAHFFFVPKEESHLEQLFGDAYHDYTQRVRRWF